MRAKRYNAPIWLTGKIARTYFYDRAKELPQLDSGQKELLAKAAAEHESYINMQMILEDHYQEHQSFFVTGSQGQLVAHPATKLQQQHGEALRAWEKELRNSLKNDEPAAAGEDELDNILGFRVEADEQ